MRNKHDTSVKEVSQATAVQRRRLRKFGITISILIIVWVLLMSPSGEYLGRLQTVFKSDGLSWKTVKEAAWDTRWYIGRFRSAPSDETMIIHLTEHRTEFNRLAEAYYGHMALNKDFSETKSDLNAHLRSLGLWELTPKMAPFIINFGKDIPTFCAFGVYFKLVDHGPTPWWNFGQKTEKAYLYMPAIPPHPKWSNDPKKWLRAYDRIELSTDRPTKTIDDEHCAVRQIDQNWFIQNCDIEAYNH